MMNARAGRLQLTALLVTMTMALLSQVAGLASWARPVRLAVDVLAMAALIKAATMWSEAKRGQAVLDASILASPADSEDDG